MVQDLTSIDMPIVRQFFPVTYRISFQINEPRALIYAYHILKRLTKITVSDDPRAPQNHYRRSISLLHFEFDFLNYQAQIQSTKEDQEQITRFNEFLGKSISRVTKVHLTINKV